MHFEDAILTDFVDETLDAPERTRVEQHLAGCAECRRLVEDLREIRRVAGSLEFREPPARAWGRIERAIALEQQAQGSRRGSHGDHQRAIETSTRRSTLIWLAAAAALVLAT